jgi:catechol 2,3-dioxygenase-like lactoylglutathione lyase family enzyme
MKLKRLGHVAICVSDLDQAAQFYQTLGLEVVWQDKDWAYLKAGHDGLALLGPDYQQAGAHFGFVLSDRQDLQSAHVQLATQGVTVSQIHEHRDGTASFYGRDPDGNTFEYLFEPVS